MNSENIYEKSLYEKEYNTIIYSNKSTENINNLKPKPPRKINNNLNNYDKHYLNRKDSLYFNYFFSWRKNGINKARIDSLPNPKLTITSAMLAYKHHLKDPLLLSYNNPLLNSIN